jgi:hypothetical protein
LLGLCRPFHNAADVDEVIGDYAEANPALHSDRLFVTATAEAVSPFDDADVPLASGAPLLAVTESALFLLAFAFKAFRGAVGDTDALDALRLCSSLIPDGSRRAVTVTARSIADRRSRRPCGVSMAASIHMIKTPVGERKCTSQSSVTSRALIEWRRHSTQAASY